MCWFTKKDLEPKVSDGSVKVFKVLVVKGEKVVSPYYDESYFVTGNPMPKVDVKPKKIGMTSVYNCKIEKGYHSYSMNVSLYGYHNFSRIGIYSSKTFNKLAFFDTDYHSADCFVIGICEIPEGVKYYENENGEIVSETILVKEILPIDESIEKYNIT